MVIIMVLSIFAEIQSSIDSMALYTELEPYRLNVTDMINKTVAYGNIELEYLNVVQYILLKYGANKITINNPSK